MVLLTTSIAINITRKEKIMSNKINTLNEMLLSQMIEDLRDPNKCTPGLYQVVRGMISDNRDQLDSIPTETLNEVEDMINNTPFKFGT